MKRDELQPASAAFSRAIRWNALNPELFYRAGRAEYALAEKNQQRDSFEKAQTYFNKFLAVMPHYGSGYLYLAMTKISSAQLSPQGLPRQEWNRIQTYFDKALSSEPGNLWIAAMTSLTRLNQNEFLSSGEQKAEEKRLYDALAIHESHLPSRYLEMSLKKLWAHNNDFLRLKRVVPQDAPSYRTFSRFLTTQKLWSYLPEVQMTSYRLNQQKYSALAGQALDLFAKSRYQEALRFFEKMLWIDQARLEGHAGILASQSKLGKRLSDKALLKLTAILEADEPGLRVLMPSLEEAVRQNGDHYTQALYDFQVNHDGGSCAKLMGQSAPDHGRVSAAQTCVNTGMKRDAVDFLSAAVDDPNPDFRELVLLLELAPEKRAGIIIKMKQISDASYAKKLWWGNGGVRPGILDRKARMYMGLNLRPGKVIVKMKARSLPDHDGQWGYMTVSLDQKVIGAAYVASHQWQEFDFEADSIGGKEHLAVDLVNGAELKAENKRPLIELGTVVIDYAAGDL